MDKIIELGRVSAETHGFEGADVEGGLPPCVFGCG
jgi:hypothetical protein